MSENRIGTSKGCRSSLSIVKAKVFVFGSSESGLDPQVWFDFFIVQWVGGIPKILLVLRVSAKFCAGRVCHWLDPSTESVHIGHLQQKSCA